MTEPTALFLASLSHKWAPVALSLPVMFGAVTYASGVFLAQSRPYLPSLLLAMFAATPLTAGEPNSTTARSVDDFLRSLGANSSVSVRGETLEKTGDAVSYTGLGWIRSGYESNVPVGDLVALHKRTGVRFSYGLMSGGTDIPKLLAGARALAAADALVAIEGANEPNNWGVTYLGQAGGGKAPTWLAVAKLQQALYATVKSDPALKSYPVWSVTENGAETDDVGLQFLTVPSGAKCLVPDGTKYADYANVHNYIYHPNSPNVQDNKTWDAADPTPACKVDGAFGNYGLTWAHHYAGYSVDAMRTLPRVTTETGANIEGNVTEDVHALNLLTLYLDQFKRGWTYTGVYLLRDRSDEGGNQQFGFYKPDYTPRKAALYLHNLTTVLSGHGVPRAPGTLDYTISGEPNTVHDLLLQKSNGSFDLIVWDEKISGSDSVTVNFSGAKKSARVYDPTVGVATVQAPKDVSSITLNLTNHPEIIEIPAQEVRTRR